MIFRILFAATLMLYINAACICDINPLSETEQIALADTADDRDYPSESFAILVDHVSMWTDGWAGPAMQFDPDPKALCANPGDVRGDLYFIRGHIDRVVRLDRPHDHVMEIAIRDDRGDALLVYMPLPENEATPQAGDDIEIPARFLMRMQAEADDGVVRTYASFVGNKPRITGNTENAPDGTNLDLAIFILLILTAVFAASLLAARRAKRRAGGHRPDLLGDDNWSDEPAQLADDPAAALRQLEEMADRSGDHD